MSDHTLDRDRDYDRDRAARELQQILLDTEDITEFLDELARYAAHAVGPELSLSCGITLERDGNPMTVASSDPRARGLDEVQYDHHHGPCLLALRTNTTVIISDLSADHRWGSYRIDALAHGIASAISISLNAGVDARGAFNLYAGHPQVFNAERQRRAEGLAGEVSRILRLAVRLSNQAQLTRHLEAAMASRSVVDQAIGIIMGQNRCTSTAAFEILRRASSHRNVKLRDIASDMVTRMGGEPPLPHG